MNDLRTATEPDEIIDALLALGSRRRSGADELTFLAEHPDPEVREVLAEVLESYRGRDARLLKERLQEQARCAGGADRPATQLGY